MHLVLNSRCFKRPPLQRWTHKAGAPRGAAPSSARAEGPRPASAAPGRGGFPQHPRPHPCAPPSATRRPQARAPVCSWSRLGLPLPPGGRGRARWPPPPSPCPAPLAGGDGRPAAEDSTRPWGRHRAGPGPIGPRRAGASGADGQTRGLCGGAPQRRRGWGWAPPGPSSGDSAQRDPKALRQPLWGGG